MVYWHCMYATVFGMCIVDANLAYKFEVEKTYGSPDNFRDLIRKLAYELINNVFQKDSITLQDIPSVQVSDLIMALEKIIFSFVS